MMIKPKTPYMSFSCPYMLENMLQDFSSLENEDDDNMFDWVDDYKATGVMHSEKDITEFKAQLAHVDHKSEVRHPPPPHTHSPPPHSCSQSL